MIQFKNVNLLRGGKPLFTDVSMTIHTGWHIGLTGTNGSGKSSFMALVKGEIHSDAGDVHLPKAWRIAHMAQEVKALKQAAIEYVLDGDGTLRMIEKKISEAEKLDDSMALATLYEQLESHDGYTARARAEQMLHGLGFKQHQLENMVSEFSGGWRMRLNLARTLMCPSDLLLLDEPTNHLDLEAIIWLESWLKQYSGTLICISHDRFFLDAVSDHIAHIEQQGIDLYAGNYTAFEKTRSEKLVFQQAAYEKQQRQKAHLHQFIDRFRAKASKARQAQSRLKALERMESLSPVHSQSPFSFQFLADDKISDPLITIRDGIIGHDNENALLKNLNLSFHPDTRIGLLGPNGAGKSTLIKAIAGKMDFRSGVVTRGEYLNIGYFAQHQLESLDMEASPCLHIQRISPLAREQEIRNFLGSYNFHGDKALESVKSFSGGEQARLALALIAWQKPNLLLLDEPTNHLDLEMRQALTLALQDFEGAVVLVSHDRALMEAVIDEFWLVNDNALLPFDGDLSDYAKWCRDQERGNRRKKNEAGNKKSGEKSQSQQKTKQKNQWQKQQKTLEKIEQSLALKNQELKVVNKALEDPGIYEKSEQEKLKALLGEQNQLLADVEMLEEKWLQAGEIMEKNIHDGSP